MKYGIEITEDKNTNRSIKVRAGVCKKKDDSNK